MKRVFADTLFWIAAVAVQDSWHVRALAAKAAMGDVHLLTTEEVLSEFLTAFSQRGEFWRLEAARTVRMILDDLNVSVIQQSHASFLSALELYEGRLDKGYSFTDCVSMVVMRQEGLDSILTNDHHFAQEGFHVLIQR